MKVSRLADYSLILVSILYSSYVSYMFLSEIASAVIAGAVATFIVVLGHHYTYQTIKHYSQTKKVSLSAVIALLLMTFTFYSEWKGQKVHAISVSEIPSTEVIDKQIEMTYNTINENANKRNWRNVEQYREASKQLKILLIQKKELEGKIANMEQEADSMANDFRFFSVLLFCIAFIASILTLEKQKETIVESIEEPYKTPEILPVKEKVPVQPVQTNMTYEDIVIDKIRKGEIQDYKEVMKLLRMNVNQANQLIAQYNGK